MTQDEIIVTILDDGRVKVETDTISPANHLNADQLLTFMAQLLGGDTQSHPKAQTHRHVHRGQQARQ